jgi:hypothetical protein
MTVSPGICVLLTIADLDRLAPLPCMDACPVCGSDQVHGQACIATRLFRTIARLGDGEIRRAEIAVVDAAFLKACGIEEDKVTRGTAGIDPTLQHQQAICRARIH